MEMQQIFFFVCLASWVSAQNEVGVSQEHNGHGWDIRLAVPGEPGSDYPVLRAIPRTGFSCAGRNPGYYADIEAGCQVFRVCTVGSTYGFQSFLCPNGTLFNQAVFVCDWWMNVNCQESQQLFSNNNNQFENLKLGPQLLKDIKKMLTHPTRNPYDRNSMKSNIIIMQDYKPPRGQLFPNGALLAGPERPPSKVSVPPKQVKQNIIQNPFDKVDNTLTATTSVPKFLPAAISTVPSTLGTIENFPRRTGDARFLQNTQLPLPENIVSNGHTRQLSSNKITDFSTNNNNVNPQPQRPTQNYILVNRQKNTNLETGIQSANLHSNQKAQISTQRTLFTDNRKPAQFNSDKQIEFRRAAKQNFITMNSNQNFPAYTYRPPLPLNIKDIPGNVHAEIKQNLVSTVPSLRPTFVTRPAASAKNLQEAKPSKPPNRSRARVTIRTWLVNPTKSAKQISSPTPYSYVRPTISSTGKLVENTTPYVYNTPTAATITELDDEVESTPYYYSRPTVASKQIVSSTIKEPSRFYLNPLQNALEPIPTFSSRLNVPVSTTSPYVGNEQYFVTPSSTPQISPRYYLPPENSAIISRQYLPPSPEQLPYQFSQLRATPSAPSPVYVSTTSSQIRPTYTVTKQSRINTNHNNLTFADILTKEKLDITVNDIVKDTNSILITASPENISQYREITKVSDYSEDNYLHTTTDNGETLTSLPPAMPSKSFRALELPLNHLVPPKETISTESTNKLSFLPYYKESLLPAPNTIERTVSLKITIPEKIASYLFKNNNDNDFDRLEILNTGSSNYLVLSNDLITSTSPSIIPIGKLVGNKNKNISNSQALVFSLLADSINAAKEYTNIAQQESLSTTLTPPPLTTAQFPNVNNGDLSEITNEISQLTSSQYSGNSYNSANIVSTPQETFVIQSDQYESNTMYTNHQPNQEQQIQLRYNIASPRQIQEQFVPPQPSIDNSAISANLITGNDNQIYSGQLYQLPVSEVTNQIYNRPDFGVLVESQGSPQPSLQKIQENSNQNSNLKQTSTEVEIVQSQSLPINSAKIQLEPSNEPESLRSDESLKNLLNSDHGISAQLQDKIIGTIPHPLEQNKLVTYEKEKSYYLFSKVDSNLSAQESKSNALTQLNNIKSPIMQSSTVSTLGNGFPNSLAFKFLPSISYQLDDVKEKEKLLNTFQIDEFGAPRDIAKANLIQSKNKNLNDLPSNTESSVEQTTPVKENENQMDGVTTLYDGPSSYLAPQSLVGSLSNKQIVQENNMNSKLETLDNSEGYPKERPSREFKL